MHVLPDLPCAPNALAPVLSAEALEFHHGKHHRQYVDTLNALIAGTRMAEMGLPDLVRGATGDVYDSAAQHYNHSLYWSCLTPDKGTAASAALGAAIERQWGSMEAFQGEFSARAGKLFGSGWCWLVRNWDGTLAIEQTTNAGCPLIAGKVPLLTCDVWEHAYYIDYRNARPKYIQAFWKIVNWDAVSTRYST